MKAHARQRFSGWLTQMGDGLLTQDQKMAVRPRAPMPERSQRPVGEDLDTDGNGSLSATEPYEAMAKAKAKPMAKHPRAKIERMEPRQRPATVDGRWADVTTARR